jgi:hypothetical protein
MNVKLDLNPTAWRARGDFEGQSRRGKRRLSYVQTVFLVGLVVGLLVGVGV